MESRSRSDWSVIGSGRELVIISILNRYFSITTWTVRISFTKGFGESTNAHHFRGHVTDASEERE